ncbi:MAG: hypothetical protein VCD00_13615 [Candidatus Hydrogenedentota bacterium]
MPVVFLRALDKEKHVLDLQGEHLRKIGENSGMSLKGYQYSFIVEDADGAPIQFDVIDRQEVVIGHEHVAYDLVSRGFLFVIDAL